MIINASQISSVFIMLSCCESIETLVTPIVEGRTEASHMRPQKSPSHVMEKTTKSGCHFFRPT